MVRVLQYSSPADGADELGAAWDAEESFTFLPSKATVGPEWVAEIFRQLPDEMMTGHFALLTSGSTGLPKLVVGRKDRTERLAGLLDRLQDLESVGETVLMLPLPYCYAFVNQWLWSRVAGKRLIATEGLSDPAGLGEALDAATDAMTCMVSAQIPLLTRALPGRSFPGITRLNFAGGRFPQEQLKQLAEVFPNAVVINNYGCAEAMPRLTLRLASEAEVASNIGWPLPGVSMRSAEDGEIQFRSEFGVVATADRDGVRLVGPEDWLGTGDVGELNADGTWTIQGRASEVFKRHGEKVSLSQVEVTVKGVWGHQVGFIRDADRAGEDGYVLVLSPEPDRSELRSVLTALRRSHPRAQWPLRVVSVDEIPMLANGKVDKVALQEVTGESTLWSQRT